MNTAPLIYRQVCREVSLAEEEKRLLLKLLREMCVNTVKYQLAWQIRPDFLALWFVSAGRFPELINFPKQQAVGDWVAHYLPFQLCEQERQLLWS